MKFESTSIPIDHRHVFLQKLDESSGFAVSECYIGYFETKKIEYIISNSYREFNINNLYPADELDYSLLNDAFGSKIKFINSDVYLYSWSPHENLPYRVHSGRELILMLSGDKPLTVLSEIVSETINSGCIPEHLFDPYVAEGRFIKMEYCEPNFESGSPIKGMRIILYALAHEGWRLNAYSLIRLEAKKLGWNDNLTRIEGRLLGYHEWQNDIYIKNMNRNRNKIS